MKPTCTANCEGDAVTPSLAPDEQVESILFGAIRGQPFHPDAQLALTSFVNLIAGHANVLTYLSDVFESPCFEQIALIGDPAYDQERGFWALPEVRAHAITESRAQCQRAAWELAESRHLAVLPQDRAKRQ